MRTQVSHRRPQRAGGITPLTLLSLALLVGVTAVAVDGGSLMEERRHVQATADAAALAAAADLFANYPTNQGIDSSGSAQSSALATAAANGFSNDGVQSIVTVNMSPRKYQAGPNAGKTLPAGYVEVIVQYNAGRTFSNVFGSGAVPVRGRSVARGQWLPVSNQVMALTTSGTGVSVNGNVNVGINGSLLANSNSSGAVTVLNNANLAALSVSLNGGGGGIVGSLLTSLLDLLGKLLGLGGSSPPTTYTLPVADPLRSLPAPDPAALGLSTQSTTALNISGGTVNLYPGVYNGGITIAQGASVTLHPNANGTPGIYYLAGGGLTVTGSSNLTVEAGNAAGVMIYNDWQTSSDTISLSTTGDLVLTPPSSGVYQGLTLFQKPGSSTNLAPELTIVASGSANITGTLYIAYGNVTLTNSGTNNLGGQIIANTITAGGGGTININANGNSVANTRTFGLVE